MSQTVKRSLSSSPTPSPSPSPPITPKKPKAKKGINTTSPPKQSPRTKSTTQSSWTNEKENAFIKRLVETGYKNMDWKSLAEETQMTEEQCKNQLTPGRSNLRKTILDMFK
ncbi:hypothetical protein L486_07041 [Kwoniella mangroviensis CBS 10435]|uniref:Myb-like domain-containing protein n=1 Tax=Kwoniella mangroviensis CBS 10435 TaxID=1331196 RepID=A0A1B9IJA0_9TREE|nr:hypothetical protein L486_07041 [Kwoniella mangroviensis CBS 10435]OCF73711.1 hypothetical protein I204_05555 [Kwoniella mangroviensis CBS 8886]